MPTINGFNNEVLVANVTFNGGTFSAGTDATDNAISIGTAANAGRTVTIGSGTAASSTVINCGTGALNIGANAIARTTTLGATTGASVLALKYGTGAFTLASATGTVMSALDTGEITYPLQPAFSAFKSAPTLNVIGNGTLYAYICDTELFDQNGDYNNATGVFTAPVTGKYLFTASVLVTGCTIASYISISFLYGAAVFNQEFFRVASASDFSHLITRVINLTAGDTVFPTVFTNGEAANTDDVSGAAAGHKTTFAGYLIC